MWSFADSSDIERADVNQTMLQPFLAYVTPKGVSYALQSEATANWEAVGGEKWTVPIYAGVAKLTRLGPFPFQIGGGVAYYVEKPQGGPDWKLRLSFTLMLPRGK